MILSDGGILHHRKQSNIIICPWSDSRLNPNSYNLRLSSEFLIYDEVILDAKKNNRYKLIEATKEEGIILEPGKLYLGKTVEYTETHRLVPMIEGRSSLGRLGVSVHITAGFGDIGYCGQWTLEISCIHPVKIYPDMEVCQIFYHTFWGTNIKQYTGKYQHAHHIQGSMLWKDFQSENELKS